MDDLDRLIDSAATGAQLEDGIHPDIVAAQSNLGRKGVAILSGKDGQYKPSKSPKWSAEDDEFLKASLGVLSEEEIAEALGRTTNAVHLRWKRDLGLMAPSKNTNIMTANQIANGLCVDTKTVHLLIDREILEGYHLPMNKIIRVVNRTTLMRFLVNPMNWIYFDPQRIGQEVSMARGAKSYDNQFWEHAKRLINKRLDLWDDAWWTPGQIASFHELKSCSPVNKAIRDGKLKASRWGNWWILRSHAIYHSFPECTDNNIKLSSSAEAFIVLGRAIGITYAQIGLFMKYKEKRVQFLFIRIRESGRIPEVIEQNKLKAIDIPETGQLIACWKQNSDRFPFLVDLIKSHPAGKGLTRSQLKQLTIVKQNSVKYLALRKKGNSPG